MINFVERETFYKKFLSQTLSSKIFGIKTNNTKKFCGESMREGLF